MKNSRLKILPSLFLAALICGPALAAAPPQPGTVNYVEGQAAIDGSPVTESSIGAIALRANQILNTQDGRAELLLTPGVFLRLGNNGAVQMNSSGLADTIVTLERGRALVEVAQILPENNIVVNENGAGVRLLKPGLYDFDSNLGVVRVYDGKASIQANGHAIEVKGDHELDLKSTGNLKAKKYDKKQFEDDFFRWASLRSSYLTEANIDAARRYAGGGGWSPGVWYGSDWYWDPYFDAYTFIPGDGIFFSPFGWGFYSPWYVFGAPYLGFYGGYGGYHHFGPGYRPPFGPRGGRFGGQSAFAGHASHFGGGSFNSSAFGSGGFRGAGGGFHGGGGFRGGGFHGGGGFGGHGGGGGGHR